MGWASKCFNWALASWIIKHLMTLYCAESPLVPESVTCIPVPCVCQSRHYVAKGWENVGQVLRPVGSHLIPVTCPEQVTPSQGVDRQLILWRVGGVGSAFFPVGHYLYDIHSLLSLDFMQQATGCYFKISKHHQKILAWIIVWQEELDLKCSLGGLAEKSSRKKIYMGFLPQLPESYAMIGFWPIDTQQSWTGNQFFFWGWRKKREFYLFKWHLGMASQFHQLRVLVWKNWLGVKTAVSKTREWGHGGNVQTILKCRS